MPAHNPEQYPIELGQAYLSNGDFDQADQLLSKVVKTAASDQALASQGAQFLLCARQRREQISNAALTDDGKAYQNSARATGSLQAIALAELRVTSETAHRAGNTLKAYSALKFSDQVAAQDSPQAFGLSQFTLDLVRLRETLTLADTVLG